MTSRPILPTPLVSTDWLATHLGDRDLRVLDATAHLAGPDPGSTVGWSLRAGKLPVAAEQTAQPRLADRRAGSRAAQHHKTLRCGQPRWALPSQIGRDGIVKLL